MAANAAQPEFDFDFDDFAGAAATAPTPKPLPATAAAIQEPFVSLEEETPFRNYGAWIDYGLRLNQTGRYGINNNALLLLDKPSDSLTEVEWNTLRSYSGWGGIQAEGERGVLYDYYTSPPIARMT
ncbi:MAG: hypothetical protein LBB98_04995 [Treponema sp.]|jgi:hypothetical protein|nr:hypothetical protein [Treponema sp.]